MESIAVAQWPGGYAEILVQHQQPPSPADAQPTELPPPWRPAAAPRQWKYIVLHHSATDSGTVAQIDAAHRARLDAQGRPWLGIAYHFVIGNGRGIPDGQVEPTFRWRDQIQGAHSGVHEYNELGIGVCLIGDLEQSAPTPAQVESARRLVAALRTEYSIPRSGVLKHSDLVATKCPGERFPFDQIAGPAAAASAALSLPAAQSPARGGRSRP